MGGRTLGQRDWVRTSGTQIMESVAVLLSLDSKRRLEWAGGESDLRVLGGGRLQRRLCRIRKIVKHLRHRDQYLKTGRGTGKGGTELFRNSGADLVQADFHAAAGKLAGYSFQGKRNTHHFGNVFWSKPKAGRIDIAQDRPEAQLQRSPKCEGRTRRRARGRRSSWQNGPGRSHGGRRGRGCGGRSGERDRGGSGGQLRGGGGMNRLKRRGKGRAPHGRGPGGRHRFGVRRETVATRRGCGSRPGENRQWGTLGGPIRRRRRGPGLGGKTRGGSDREALGGGSFRPGGKTGRGSGCGLHHGSTLGSRRDRQSEWLGTHRRMGHV